MWSFVFVVTDERFIRFRIMNFTNIIFTRHIIHIYFSFFFLFFFGSTCPSTCVCGRYFKLCVCVCVFVSDLRKIGGFLRVLRFPPSIKIKHCWKWHYASSNKQTSTFGDFSYLVLKPLVFLLPKNFQLYLAFNYLGFDGGYSRNQSCVLN